MTLSNIILAGSPYFIIYTGTSNLFDYITIDLYIWEGDYISTPFTPTYTLTSYKVKNSDSYIVVPIQDYIKDMLDPIPDATWIDNEIGDANFKEFVCVKWTIRSYKLVDGVGVLYQTSNSPQKVSSLGYSPFQKGSNPSPSDVTIDTTEKYNTTQYNVYETYLNGSSTSSNDVIIREMTNPGKIMCSGQHKPIQILYLNKNGIFESFTFTRALRRSIKFKSDTYDRRLNGPFYDNRMGSKVISNRNGVVKWTMNTDLLDEYNYKSLEELVASDRHFMIDHTNYGYITPLIITFDDLQEKNSVNNQADVQYTVEFEEANSYKQNIR